jgi:hypothetical protein
MITVVTMLRRRLAVLRRAPRRGFDEAIRTVVG